ncbi:hypothetical protein DNU06_01735 [Putridiphycobacter roseus]|uniref:Uncharacterized protein n=1 Tax=Putridiphycobacter roseus TaxID=2219161 RepID=A0A2W1N2P4_9FLAO|nr:hypothetical protein [Putridiphycobacter roseus]PZE18577.1 hypothetical protein DNU06_01735 [Putridiphycobacter roseus]
MKKGLVLIGFLVFALAFAQQVTNLTEFKESIKLNKAEAKTSIKPYLYDGYKTTYFNYKTYKQSKEVEIYLFNNTEYKLAFNGKACSKNITVNVYNESKSVADRILLKEITDIKGNNIVIETDDLNDAYVAAGGSASRLKRVFVDYVIPATPDANNANPTIEHRGAVVLVMGYKN